MATLASGAVRLRSEVDALYPKRDKQSDGWVADARHVSGGISDHIPDKRGVVHAIDIDRDLDPANQRASWQLADAIRKIAATDGRIAYLIHMGQIASPRRNLKGKAWQWRKHVGDPHMHHIHISFTIKADTSAAPFGLIKELS